MKNLYTLVGLILCCLLITTLNISAKERKNQQPGQEVSGILTYPEGAKMPRNAIVSVRIVDVNTQNASRVVIAQTTGPLPRALPTSFDVIVGVGRINGDHNYVLQAVITSKDRTIWRNAYTNPVITSGNATQLIVPMEHVSARPKK